MAFGWDGENYLPVGHLRRRSNQLSTDRVFIETLPPAIDYKSLKGSVRLLFRRFVHKMRGGTGVETRLARVSVDHDSIVYDDDPVRVREAVGSAARVLVLVHGILGDTEGMARAALLPDAATPGFGQGYDVVLAFDYENINTTIDVTAASLLTGLRAATTGAPDGQALVVVAHSMGGLVARWLIERLDSRGLVDRLITAGTPNGGSPWPVVEDWALVALTFGLNQLAAVAWPLKGVSYLLKLIEHVDNALDDMNPSSQRLADLRGAADPEMPYTVIIGDRSLAVPIEPAGRVGRLLASLKTGVVDKATWLAFLGGTNDLAVSLASALDLPDGRYPAPRFIEGIACDHLTYFSQPAGLAAIREAAAPTE